MAERHDLLELLDKERIAILRGGFDEFTALAVQKEQFLADLPMQKLDLRDLHRIFVAVSRNQALLDAAIKGVRDVTERLEVLRKSSHGFAAYGREGERVHVGTAQTQFERKA